MSELTGQSAREAFESVADFLDRHGYHIAEGYGRDHEVAYHGGHTQRHLAELYEREANDGPRSYGRQSPATCTSTTRRRPSSTRSTASWRRCRMKSELARR